MRTYYKPRARAEFELEIKRSLFIAIAEPVSSIESCQAFIRAVKAEYPDARHHCTAFIAGAPNDTQVCGMSDDGEPSGTAGKPMLNILSHSGLGQIAVVIVRYFGGIKLGTGGLVKAYSQATQEVLAKLERVEVVPLHSVSIIADYAYESDVRHWLQQLSAQNIAVDYSDQVLIQCCLEEPETLADKLQQVGQGQITFKYLSEA